MKIGIIVALSVEHEQLAKLLENKTEREEFPFKYVEGSMGGNEIILTQCGIGKVNAAMGTVELIRRYHPDCIINTGVAGSIDSCIRVMDVVVGERVIYHDVNCGPGNGFGQVQGCPNYFDAAPALWSAAFRPHYMEEGKMWLGTITSGDQFIEDPGQVEYIKSHIREGMAVDMESGAIAQVCYIYKVPFVSIRIISDAPGDDKLRFQQYTDFWGELAHRSFRVTRKILEEFPTEL